MRCRNFESRPPALHRNTVGHPEVKWSLKLARGQTISMEIFSIISGMTCSMRATGSTVQYLLLYRRQRIGKTTSAESSVAQFIAAKPFSFYPTRDFVCDNLRRRRLSYRLSQLEPLPSRPQPRT